jgi:hypothetical protein
LIAQILSYREASYFAEVGGSFSVENDERKENGMCTMIVKRLEVEGTGKGAGGWFPVRQANVSYDHPFSAPMDHALNIDFVNDAQGPGARVAVELDVASARNLVQTILAVLDQAEVGGFIE